MIGQLYINDKDAYLTWGIFLEDGSEGKLLTPAPNKEYAGNKMRSQHGKQVFRTNPRKDERDLILVFCISADTKYDFLIKYRAFIDELDSGITIMRVTSLREVYKLDAIGYQELSFYKRIGKLSVRFNESNPQDRIQF
jgi:hypothetical protein